MNKLSKLIFVISISFNLCMNAQRTVLPNKRPISTVAKLTGAQCLRGTYLVSGIWHVIAVIVSSHFHLEYMTGKAKDANGKLVEFRFSDFLKQVSTGFLMEVGSAYSSFHAYRALSDYIKKANGCPIIKTQDTTDIPAQFDLESEEDEEKALAKIAFHSWIVFSSLFRIYKNGEIYKSAYCSLRDRGVTSDLSPRSTSPGIGRINKWNMILAPVLAPARLYSAWSSFKTICKKAGNIIRSYKKELPQ